MTNGTSGAMQTPRGGNNGQAGKVVPLRDLLSDPHDRVLRAAVIAVLSRAISVGERDFVLDLTGVVSLDRTGLALLVDLLRRVCGEGGTVRISGAGPSVRRTLAVSCLSSLFE